MATTIKLKNGSGAPTAGDLVQGEPAIDLTNKRLYTEDSGGSVIEVGSNPSSLSIAGTAVTATATELNALDGITSTTAELNILDGVTSTAAELNILDGVTASTAEINLLDGVTSTTAELNILDGVTSTAAELNILDGVTSTTAELNILDGVTATAAELNVLDGVTAFVDEDDMSSDSATSIPSQQSVKAYVDAQLTASDLDFQGDSGGALSIDLDSETLTVAGGTGIDTSGATNTLTVAIDSTVATLTGTQTLTNKTLTSAVLNTGVSGTAVLDEDDMSSDSATQLATQQSIKAYVDSQVASADTLSELTDTNITSPADGALLFYDTGTSKWIDNVVSGDVTIADTGVAAIGSGVIVNDDINASAAISVSKTALTAGTGLTLTTNTLSVDASQTQITAVGTIGTGTWQGSVISDTYVANDLTISGGTIENTVIGAATPAAGTFTTFTSTGIDDNATSTAITIDSSQNVTVGGTTAGNAGSINLTAGSPGSTIGGLQLWSTTSGSHFLQFGDTASGNGYFRGAVGYLHASDALVAYSAGSERMRIDSSGNVGIGTASPSSTGSTYGSLTLSGSAGGEVFVATGGTTKGVLFNYSSDANNVGLAATDSSGDLLFSTGGFNERMRIDASGNVGIGTTVPSAKLSIHNSLSTTYSTTGYAATPSNSMLYLNNTNGGSDTASLINFRTGSGDGVVGFVEGGGTNDADFIIQTDGGSNGVERFRITNAGNVGIGTSAPQSLLQLNKTPPTAFGSPFLSVGFNTFTSSGMYTVAFGYEALSGSIAPAEIGLVTTSDSSFTKGDLVFATRDVVTNTAPTERMRIASNGYLLIGTTTVPNGSADGIAFYPGSSGRILSGGSTGTFNQVLFYNPNGSVGSIQTSGSATAYNTSSDVRLKENIADAPAGNIDSIRVRSFDWKADGSHQTYGMVAQELVDVAPEAVSQGETEDDMWAVDYSKLVPMMIKEIQDLKAEVAALKGA